MSDCCAIVLSILVLGLLCWGIFGNADELL
jgi:hypothetical protein